MNSQLVKLFMLLVFCRTVYSNSPTAKRESCNAKHEPLKYEKEHNYKKTFKSKRTSWKTKKNMNKTYLRKWIRETSKTVIRVLTNHIGRQSGNITIVSISTSSKSK